MDKKILIAEDADYIPSGIKEGLNRLQIFNIDYVKYCDEAFLKIKKAQEENNPYDLLISDLSFVGCYYNQKIKSGEDLIKKIKRLPTPVKVVVFSIENKTQVVQQMYNELFVNAYVLKDVNGLKELMSAVKTVFKGERYLSPSLKTVLKCKEASEITDYDIFLLKYLSIGLEQKEISLRLKSKKFVPNGISSIEKRVKILKEYFEANNTTHLITMVKDLGLI